jgi:Xaa-Pro aminopeptidase
MSTPPTPTPTPTLTDLREALARSRAAVQDLARSIVPGMREPEAFKLINRGLFSAGIDHLWHKTQVRFGANTRKWFDQPSDPDVVLGADDVFYLDVGPVWGGVEGDYGETFTTGTDAEMARISLDGPALWQALRDAWQAQALTGVELYERAAARAKALGWELSLTEACGHRIGRFPHPRPEPHFLNELAAVPEPGGWILELHLLHPTRPFGAFYEALLA